MTWLVYCTLTPEKSNRFALSILTLKKNTEVAKKVIDVIIKIFNLNIDSSDPIQTCLDSAIVSNITTANIETMNKLSHILRRYKNDKK